MEVKILSRKDLEQVLEMSSVIEGVRSVYRLKAVGETEVWPLVAYDFKDPGAVMDIRSGAVLGGEQLHGLKMLNNFPGNREKGLPTFTGMLMVFDSTTGLPLGVMDASYVTGMRTGAAGAVAAAALAREDSQVLTVLGAGKQAMFQIAAATITMPGIRTVYVADQLDKDNERAFAAACRERLRPAPRRGGVPPGGGPGPGCGQKRCDHHHHPLPCPGHSEGMGQARHPLQLYRRGHGGQGGDRPGAVPGGTDLCR